MYECVMRLLLTLRDTADTEPEGLLRLPAASANAGRLHRPREAGLIDGAQVPDGCHFRVPRRVVMECYTGDG